MALESGADAYLVEPISPDLLLATVRALIRQWQMQNDLRAAQNDFKLAKEEHERYHNLLQALMDYIPEGITIADAPDVTIRCARHRLFEAAREVRFDAVTPAIPSVVSSRVRKTGGLNRIRTRLMTSDEEGRNVKCAR